MFFYYYYYLFSQPLQGNIVTDCSTHLLQRFILNFIF